MRRLACFCVLVLVLTDCAGPSSVDRTGFAEDIVVASVTDGDTIRVVVDGREVPVRLIGIDTPEKDGPYTDLECFGEEASRFTLDLLDGETIALEFDVELRDRYERVLAYVWIGSELANDTIVREGYALPLTIPPNVRYADRFVEAADEARREGRGLWRACD